MIADVFEGHGKRHVAETEFANAERAGIAATEWQGFAGTGIESGIGPAAGSASPWAADDEVDPLAGGIELGGIELGGAQAEEVDGFLDGGILEIDARDDDGTQFIGDVCNASAIGGAGQGSCGQLGGVGRDGKFPGGIHLGEQLGAGLIEGGAVVVRLGGGEALHAAAGGGVVGIDAEHVFVFALGLVELAEIEIAFSSVKGAADLIDVLGMLVSERGIGADGIVQITELAFGEGVVGIHGNDIVEQGAGLGVFAHLAVLHGERHAGIGKVLGITLAAVGKHRRFRQLLDRLRVFVHGLLVIALGIGLTAFGKQAVRLGHIILAADHFTLGKAAVAITGFTGICHGGDDWHGGCGGHQRDGGATGTRQLRMLHSVLRFSD